MYERVFFVIVFWIIISIFNPVDEPPCKFKIIVVYLPFNVRVLRKLPPQEG